MECTLIVVVGELLNVKNINGFSMLEMAIVTLVIGILTSGLLPFMKIVQKDRMLKQTQKTLDKLVTDSMGYAIIHGTLPEKIENLGSDSIYDAWGNKIIYVVDQNYRAVITPATQSKLCEPLYSVDCINDRADDLYIAAIFSTVTPLGELKSYVSENALKYYMVSSGAIYP